jgi:hypothetical protein
VIWRTSLGRSSANAGIAAKDRETAQAAIFALIFIGLSAGLAWS